MVAAMQKAAGQRVRTAGNEAWIPILMQPRRCQQLDKCCKGGHEKGRVVSFVAFQVSNSVRDALRISFGLLNKNCLQD